ncbi:MAG: HAD-IA family hydrolase [Oscillospiraceae bacterium]|jgi:putative hydrolase of the HAD superfamily|nr:HAD-IA family hydrolase [Oscillospiraceae bacterium]
MTLPKMILFDYGGTLIAEPNFSSLRAVEMYDKHVRAVLKHGYEVTEESYMRLAYGLLGIEFGVPYEELSRVFWDGCSDCAVMPHIEELLEYLQTRGIRTGVISNLTHSGDTLRGRIDRMLPRNGFEFIIASSDYGVRKPDPLIFELALAKADLAPEDVWFCGDDVRCDVDGAAAAGLHPVFYTGNLAEHDGNDGAEPSCEHLHIGDWRELTGRLEALSGGKQ